MKAKKFLSVILAAQVTLTGTALADPAAVFDDIDVNDEVYGAVKLLKNLGIIAGVGDNKFEPESTVTRADFAVMIDKAAALDHTEDHEYSDVPADSYFAKSVSRATAAGIIHGDGEGSFNPYAPINKQEAAVILTKAYESYIGKTIFAPKAAANYPDYERIAPWAKSPIDKAVLMGFIATEADGTIGATADFTRADTALAIAKLLLLAGDEQMPDDSAQSYIEQWNRGNIFVGAQTPGFTVKTGNNAIEYVVTDYYNSIVRRETKLVDNGSIDLTFDGLEPGYYEVGIYSADNGGVKHEIIRTSMAYFTDYDFKAVDPKDSHFGMNMHCDRGSSGWRYDLLNEAEIIGVKHIRDGYEWPGVEGSLGNYTRLKNVLDNFFNLLNEHGMTIHLVTGFSHSLYDGGATPYTDAGRQGFANYSKSFFDLYDIEQTQEMFNEFWGQQFGDRGDGPADGLPEYYVPLVEKIYTTIKQSHPDAQLALCLGSEDWTERVLALGALDYTDFLTAHMYGARLSSDISLEDSLRDFHNQKLFNGIEKYADGRTFEVWNTETGNSTSTNYIGIPEKTQAKHYPRIALTDWADGITRSYFYDLLDDGNSDSEHEDRFGILHAFGDDFGSYTPKPAYVSYGAMARELTAAELINHQSLDSGIEWYTFTKGADKINVLNTRGLPSREDYKDVIVYADKPVTITDIMGKSEVYTPVDGKLYLTLNGDVLYIKGDITDVLEKQVAQFTVSDWVPTGAEYTIASKSLDISETNDMKITLDSREYTVGEQLMKADGFYLSGTRNIIIDVTKGGKLCGRLMTTATSQKNYNVEIDSGVEYVSETDDYKAILRMKVTNNTPYDTVLNSVLIGFDGESTEKYVNEALKAKETKDITIEMGKAELRTSHEISTRLCIDGVLSDEIDASGKFQYNAISRRTIAVDGILDDGMEEIVPLTVKDNGEVFALASDGSKYNGDNDLSGNIWITYDDENFYITADIIDDSHDAPSADSQIWRNDSMQIDFYQHETEGYNLQTGYTEIGVSLLADGTVGKWVWKQVKDLGDSQNPNGVQAAVTRNNATKHTVYEIAISWKDAGGIDVDNITRLDLSLCINDCDNGVRQTAFEIGGGIVMGKAPEKYNKYSLIR